MANFTCLAAARHAVLSQAGWDVEADGLFGAPEVTVVVGEEVHVSLVKSLGLAGFGRNRVVHVPVDKQGRMRVDMFPTLSGPTIVCLQAAMAVSAAYLPSSSIRDPMNFTPELSRRARGIEVWTALQAFSRMAPVGAAEPPGRGKRPCASACRHGPRPTRMSNAACKP